MSDSSEWGSVVPVLVTLLLSFTVALIAVLQSNYLAVFGWFTVCVFLVFEVLDMFKEEDGGDDVDDAGGDE